MAFMNEFISEEDVEKYDLKAIDEKFFVGRTKSRQWTIDRGRNIYLRNVARGGGADPEVRNQTKWTLFWGNTLLTLRLDLIEGKGAAGEPGWSHWKLMRVNGSNGLPSSLKVQEFQIFDDLKEALTAYRGAGIYSANYTNYSVLLDVDEGCLL